MSKLFLSFLLFAVVTLQNFPQATVTNIITVDDGVIAPFPLYFGLDPLATDGIDTIFQESDLPPAPPAGSFDARLVLPQGGFSGALSSWKDFRFATLPFTGQKEFRLKYQKGSGTVINFNWNLPTEVTGQLQDIITGTIVNQPMVGIGSYQLILADAIPQLKMFINYNAVLPVELTSFSALKLDNKVRLKWYTATEINNYGFEIQRKKDQSTFEKIGFINGHGNSNSMKSYEYNDKLEIAGLYTYRLKQIDVDGQYEYSTEVVINISAPQEFALFQNYPNPFNPSTLINFSLPVESNVNLNIYNSIGQKIDIAYSGKLSAGFHSVDWSAKSFSSGVYYYELSTESFRSIKKMILSK